MCLEVGSLARLGRDRCDLVPETARVHRSVPLSANGHEVGTLVQASDSRSLDALFNRSPVDSHQSLFLRLHVSIACQVDSTVVSETE